MAPLAQKEHRLTIDNTNIELSIKQTNYEAYGFLNCLT